MQEPDTTWLAEEPADTTRRRRLVVAAATVPWAIVLVVVLTPRQTITVDPPHQAVESRSTTATADAQITSEPESAPGAMDGSNGVGDLLVTELRGGWRDTPGQGAAAAVAVASVHRWLAENDAVVAVDADDRLRDVDRQLVVEAVEQLDDRLAVVTLISVRASAAPERFGIGVWIDGSHARPAGTPWRLPEIVTDVEPYEADPIDDPLVAYAVLEALEQAGYRQVELHSVERTSSWPWRAHVDAITPAGHPVETPVLLRRHLDGYVVAGTVLTPHVADGGSR